VPSLEVGALLIETGRNDLIDEAGPTERSAACVAEMATRNTFNSVAGRLNPALAVNRDAVLSGLPGT